jgi:hypothetical protein
VNWGQVGLAVLLSVVAVSLADWLFMAVLFHEKYKAYPDVWRRPQGGAGEGNAIGLAAAAALLTPLAFVPLCARFGLTAVGDTLLFAGAVWLIAPVPLLVGNFLFVKLHPLVLVSHLAGWLVKLLAVGAITGWMLA